MIIIPAIDIKQGKCVRLEQGDMTKESVFSDNPEEMAQKWYGLGAERIHLVDLDGAVEGRPVNGETIKRIVDAVPVPVQLGGGIRDKTAVRAYFDLGIASLILGTVAYTNPDFVRETCRDFPGQMILGIDARQGRVAVKGWTEDVDLSPLDFARLYEDAGISSIVYTDVQRDGMQTGPNIEATRMLAKAVGLPVIVSGGISGISDVIDVLPLEDDGVVGMITGRALYEGSLDLGEAISLCKSRSRKSFG